MKWHRIFWHEFKESKKAVLFFTVIISLFSLWLLSIFDPELFAGMEEIFEQYPEAIKEMVGGQIAIGTVGGFLNVYLFSMAWFYLGFFFVFRAANDIPTEIEEKTIDLLLSKPVKRWEFVLGKHLEHALSALFITACISIVTLIGIFSLSNIHPGDVHFFELIVTFIWLGIFLVALTSTGILFSTFLSTKKSIVFSLGTMIFFYVLGTYWRLFDESMQGIKYLSIFYYFRTYDLLVEHAVDYVAGNMLILVLYSVGALILSVVIFNERDIPN